MVSFTDHYNAIPIGRHHSKTKIGKVSWYFNKKRYFLIKKRKVSVAEENSSLHESEILFFVSPISPQLQRLFFFIKKKTTTTLQQVTGGNTPNLVLKRMQRYFLKIQPLQKLLQFQHRIYFFY